MADAKVHVRAVLDLVTVRPGDTLVVAVDQDNLTREDADRLIAGLKERLPGVTPLIITAKQLMVYRPDSLGES